MPGIEIQPVHTPQELRELVAFAWELYKDDPLWVPPLFDDRVARLDPARNPMLKHGALQAYLARRDGRIVGTIAGAIDYNLKQVIPDPFAAFGFFECIDDYEVARALFDAAVSWSRAQGQVRLRGPYNPTQNDEQGFLVDGRDRPPVIMTGHNPPWYPEFADRYGFKKWGPDELCYEVHVAGLKPDLSNLPPKLLRVVDAVRKRTHAVVRPLNLKDWDAECERARGVYNAALSTLGDFVPLDRDEFRRQADAMRPILDPQTVLFVEVDGKPVGWAVGLFNYFEALQHANGLRRPWNYLRLLLDRRHIHCLSLKIVAVDPAYWSRGLDALIYAEMARQVARRNGQITWMDLSLTGEDNPQTNKLAKVVGAVPYKRYRIYQLDLVPEIPML